MKAEIIVNINYIEEDIKDFDKLEQKILNKLKNMKEFTLEYVEFRNIDGRD